MSNTVEQNVIESMKETKLSSHKFLNNFPIFKDEKNKLEILTKHINDTYFVAIFYVGNNIFKSVSYVKVGDEVVELNKQTLRTHSLTLTLKKIMIKSQLMSLSENTKDNDSYITDYIKHVKSTKNDGLYFKI